MNLEALVKACEGHTPGPWTDDICTFGPDGKPVPIMCCTEEALLYGWGEKESRANARLIAAAPDLLALAESQARRIAELEATLRETIGYVESLAASPKGGPTDDDYESDSPMDGYHD